MYKLFPALALSFLLVFSACTPEFEEHPPGAPANPLTPCPDTPNCVLATRLFDTSPDSLFQSARQALQSMDASEVKAHARERRLDAVFSVFLFKDDVAILIVPQTSGAALHIRSASRTGYSDLGVNSRRVQHFFETLAAK